MRRVQSWSCVLTAALVAGCTPSGADPHVEPHDEMPEAAAPVTQRVEAGPVFERVLGADELAAFEVQDGLVTAAVVALPSPASRTTVWLTMADETAGTPEVLARAGWANGQTTGWRVVPEIASEGAERVLALDLETAATTLQLRWTVAPLETLRWAASVPLEPGLLAGALPDATAPSGSVTVDRASWGAVAARCGEDEATRDAIVISGLRDAVDEAAALRAMQRRDRDGLGWCDVRPSYVVGKSGVFLARGPRRAASAPTRADNAGRAAVAVFGCAPEPDAQDKLRALLDELVARHALTQASQVEVAPSPACPDTTSLDAALAAWLATDPFEAPPPPPPEVGAVSGLVEEAPGTPAPGAQVGCTCGASATTDAAGRFLLTDVAPGRHQLTVTKAGFRAGAEDVDVRADETTEVTVRLEPDAPTGVSVINHAFLIDHFGGTNADPLAFDQTQDGFQAYLDAVGVTYFAAWEYVVPNNQSVATSCGYTILLPERALWPRAAALGLLADRLRALVDEPVTLRNWWRPPCYNEGVGGAPGGDHPDADALDLDFRSAASRAAAQRYLCDTYWKQDIVPPEDVAPGSGLNPRLNMSIGLGGATIHLGLLSRNGRRFWKYSSYTNQPGEGDCW